VSHAEQGKFTLPEPLISLLVFIEVQFLVFWILSFDCSFCLIAWYLYIFDLLTIYSYVRKWLSYLL